MSTYYPKEMAVELFMPFIIRRLIERGVVETVKAAKKLIEEKDSIIWDVLENVLKGHPILLNLPLVDHSCKDTVKSNI